MPFKNIRLEEATYGYETILIIGPDEYDPEVTNYLDQDGKLKYYDEVEEPEIHRTGNTYTLTKE